MSEQHAVLVLGGTGRTGGRVVGQLLERGAHVRAIVRSAERLPAGMANHANLTVTEADVLLMPHEELLEQVRGCEAVVSCLGHNINLKGVFGPPHDLVTRATERVCHAIAELRPPTPVKFVLMSTVAVGRPNRFDRRRGALERAALAVIRALVPAARDNQNAADFLCADIGQAHPFVQWVVVRPDTLLDGDVSQYAVHQGLVSSLVKPDQTARSNVAHFMCELITAPKTWDAWQGRLPVIVNAVSK